VPFYQFSSAHHDTVDDEFLSPEFYERFLQLWLTRYLYIFSKNDVISSVRKRYCALGLGLQLGFAEIRFSVKHVFEQV